MKAQHGFTFFEIVWVMLITGILAVVTVPKLFKTSEFAARGARDFIASTVRYAQKSAIAMRRNVCVSIAGSTVTATYASSSGSNQACVAANTLANPANGLPMNHASNALPSGATVVGAPSVAFDAMGRPLAVATLVPRNEALSISVTSYAIAVVIEAETGLVH
jgi:MSHA pilin protein MshC